MSTFLLRNRISRELSFVASVHLIEWEIFLNMEPICHGWLIKSPPKQKSSGAWKIFGAKWKRRYFVLYAPPLISAIIGARAAMLEYYSSKKMNTKVGAINLEDCDEVLSNLDSDIYKNIFGLHTKHKGRDRIYYLVADTEMEMNNWVSNLCNVLGLLENDENKFQFSPESRAKSASCILSKPRPNLLTHPNRKNTTSMAISLSSSSGFSSLSSRLNSSESNLLDSKLFNEKDEGSMKSCGSVPELESISIIPVPAKKRENMELPPVPPEKTRKSFEDLISEGIHGGAIKIAPVSNLMAEECLGMPPPKPPKEKKRDRIAQEEYNVPKPFEVEDQSYDMPKMSLQSTDSTDEIQSETSVYNAPKPLVSQNSLENPPLTNMRWPPIPARRKSVLSKTFKQTNAISEDEFYCAPKSNPILLGEAESSSNVGSFYNVLPNFSIHGKDGGLPLDQSEPSYDVPNPSSSEIQPIMGRKAEKLQKNTYDAPTTNYDDMYDAPKNAFKPVPAKRTQIASQSTSPPCNPTSPKKPDLPAKPKVDKKQVSMKLSQPANGDFQTYSSPRTGALLGTTQSFQKKTSAQVVIENSIRFTQRSKSFKRSLNGPESNEKQMPTKRINEKEASSDDCDSDDEC